MTTLAARLYADTERRRTWSDEDYRAAVACLHQERLVTTAKAIAATEGRARCSTEDWNELHELTDRLGQWADVATEHAGRPGTGPAAATHALTYARHLAKMERCAARASFDSARRWQDKAIAACDAMLALIMR